MHFQRYITFSVLQLIEVLMVCVYPVRCEVTEEAVTGVSGQIGHCLPVVELHLLHPAVVLCVVLVGFLDSFGKVALHSKFRKFGPCLRLAIGG